MSYIEICDLLKCTQNSYFPLNQCSVMPEKAIPGNVDQ